ncbi:MAG: tungstate ABC transporter substrate-binding protein WtpA [Chloroflexi bacterium]|nr:tungstate ABC transporter substrate-binding protein WtpA [Chloroflexota bacterium]
MFTMVVGCATQPAEKIPLRIIIAGSLMTPFDELKKAYEAEHPGIDIQIEAHGSIQAIRLVSEVHMVEDIVFSADHALIPMLMYQTTVPETGKPYANWYIKFATNHLALAYTAKSKYANEINADNWYKIIARSNVKLGLADPRFDAVGYRALMALQLAKAAYGKPTIFEDVMLGQFKSPVTMETESGRAIIHVPEILETKPQSSIVLRGASMQEIALLESGDVDYAFEYESVIQQHKLNFIKMPDAVNLGNEQMVKQYGTVQVRLDFKRFASVKPEFNGEVIGYGLTIPSNAPHPQQAQDFIIFMLGPKGRAIMQANYHPLFASPQADQINAVPTALKALCVPMPLAQ